MVKLVIIESPFAAPTVGRILDNIEYGWLCVQDSLKRGEVPFASHLFYPNVLSDTDPSDRNLGMACGWAWMAKADLVAVYTNFGVSQGMQEGITQAKLLKIPVEHRALYVPAKESPK